MSDTLALVPSLLDTCSELLKSNRIDDARRLLTRLLNRADLTPAVASRANFLLARLQYHDSQFADAQEMAARAVDTEPGDADHHFLLAQAIEREAERDPKGEEDVYDRILHHYRAAHELDPNDPLKAVALGRCLLRGGDEQGLQLLERAFSEHPTMPNVILALIDGLIESGRGQDAELLITQVSYRCEDLPECRTLRDQLRQRARELRLFHPHSRREDDEQVEIIPFRSFGTGARTSAAESTRRVHVMADESTTTLGLREILASMSNQEVRALSERLRLKGRRSAADERDAIARHLSNDRVLSDLIDALPVDSRRLLFSLCQIGGKTPLDAIFQLTGASQPPADYVQPLVRVGLVYLSDSCENDSSGSLWAEVPTDLAERIRRFESASNPN